MFQVSTDTLIAHECPVRRTHRKSSTNSGDLTRKSNGCWIKSSQCYHMTLEGLSMAARPQGPIHHSTLSWSLSSTLLTVRRNSGHPSPHGYWGLSWLFDCPLALHKCKIEASCGTGAPVLRRWLSSESCNTRRGRSLPLRRQGSGFARAPTGRRAIPCLWYSTLTTWNSTGCSVPS